MRRLPTAAIALIVTGLAGCSSPAAPKPAHDSLPAGTAHVLVNGNDTGTIHAVECQTPGDALTVINIGRNDGGVTVLVDRRTPKAVTFNDFGGLNGSYWQDLQGAAQLDMVDQTYRITGTAAGFNTADPHIRTTNTFTVNVAC